MGSELDGKRAAVIGLEVVGRQRSHGAGGAQEGSTVYGVDVELQGFQLLGQTMDTLSLEELSAQAGRALDGIIGHPIFKTRRMIQVGGRWGGGSLTARLAPGTLLGSHYPFPRQGGSRRHLMAKAKKKTAARKAKPATKSTKKKAAPKPIDQEAMMAAWQKAMSPSEGHRRLEPLVGVWRTRTTFVMDPGAAPSVSEGSSEHRWVLGGRYLEQVYKGASMGMPFEGIGYTGYDNTQGKYVGTWMDSFGTGLMNSVGTGRPKDGALDFHAESRDPSGKVVGFECNLRIQDHDHNTYEMWTKAPNGRLYRVMLVEYTRS